MITRARRRPDAVSLIARRTLEATDTELKFDKLSAYVDELSAPASGRRRNRLRDRPAGFSADASERERQDAQVDDDAPLMNAWNTCDAGSAQLAGHGGRVTLIGSQRVQRGLAPIANGCSMVDVTLKEGIEKAAEEFRS